ncbi:MAG TPA: acylphosphatase [Vicinamibacterales bacterium]|nr:acylphosphatase [Vicinamibacterales bacterium]
MRIARRYLIRGRVQGVGFRFFTEHAAAREGIQGWVRNLSDGSVEVAAEGEAEAMTRFEHALGQGPRNAHVDGVDAIDDVPGGHSGFTIR